MQVVVCTKNYLHYILRDQIMCIEDFLGMLCQITRQLALDIENNRCKDLTVPMLFAAKRV